MARESNFELLRIFSLFMVVGIHVAQMPMYSVPLNSLNWQAGSLIGCLSRPAVDLFVLIGAYFMVGNTDYNDKILKRVKRITYPFAIYFVATIVAVTVFMGYNANIIAFLQNSLNGTFGYFGPIKTGHLWFVFTYLFLILLSPMLNIVIREMNKRNFKILLAILFILFLFIPSVNNYSILNLISRPGNNLLIFITLYFLAGYIKKFDLKLKFSYGLAIFAVCGIVTSLATWYFTGLTTPLDMKNHNLATAFFQDYSIPVVIGALALFLAIKDIRFQSKLINIFGKATYDAYLIHYLFYFLFVRWFSYLTNFDDGTIVFTLATLLLIGAIGAASLCYGIVAEAFLSATSRIWKTYRERKGVPQPVSMRMEKEEGA